MNLLVTGGAGFIGARLIQRVLDQPEVTKLVNLDALTYAGDLQRLDGIHNRHPRYVFEHVNLRDREAVARVVREHAITHVMHLAAETHVDRSIAAAGIFVESNVMGTLHLIEACRESWEHLPAPSQPRFVHVSTDEVYGALTPDEAAFTETHPLLPNSPYSASKAAADHLIRAFVQTHGLPAVITRCSNNFGPGQHEEKLIPTVLRALRDRQPIPVYGDGMQSRDWLHVDDHAEALWRVLQTGQVGEVYNIGACNEWTNLRLIERLCDLFDTLQSGGESSRSLISHVTDRPGHDRRYAMDAEKICRELGWKASRDFDQALADTVRHFLGMAG